jgi:hypothetical protein
MPVPKKPIVRKIVKATPTVTTTETEVTTTPTAKPETEVITTPTAKPATVSKKTVAKAVNKPAAAAKPTPVAKKVAPVAKKVATSEASSTPTLSKNPFPKRPGRPQKLQAKKKSGYLFGNYRKASPKFEINSEGYTTRESINHLVHEALKEAGMETPSKKVTADLIRVIEETMLNIIDNSQKVNFLGGTFKKRYSDGRVYSSPATPYQTYMPPHDTIKWSRYADPDLRSGEGKIQGTLLEDGTFLPVGETTPITIDLTSHKDKAAASSVADDEETNASVDSSSDDVDDFENENEDDDYSDDDGDDFDDIDSPEDDTDPDAE